MACEGNATLITVDLDSGRVIGTDRVGNDPDVLAYDVGAHRLFVASESGWVTILDTHGRKPVITGSDHLGDGAHVVAVDPTTGHTFYPLPTGPGGHPTLLDEAPL